MATTELKRTISSAGSQTKWGASAWVKLSGAGTIANTQAVYCSSKSDTTANLRGIMINSDYRLQVAFYDGGYSFQVETNRLLRDPSGFYHLCVAYDSSESTAADRIKMYVNGVLETSFSTSSYPAQNSTHNFFGTDITQLVGSLREGSTICNPCVISHLHVTDGYCYPASTYGETDATTGEWKIKTNPTGVTYGTNGFFVLRDDAALTDRSGQGNNLTLGSGTLTKTEDCPSNVFATFNPLNVPTSDAPYFAAGNTDLDSCANASLFHGTSTLGMSAGKYYAEFKWKSNSYPLAGVTSRPAYDAKEKQRPGQIAGSYGYYFYNGDVKTNNSNVGSFTGATLSIGDILCIAIDCDNNKLYFRKNGDAWLNSGDPTSGSTGTGAISITPSTEEGDNWFFSIGDGDTSSSSKISANFGNGYFLTTAVSSAGSNASGLGIFEYDVPSGYTALCTKGLNE